MRLEKLQISGFGKLSDKEINLFEGVNIVFGPNESGKSTLQAFIRTMLFGLGKGKTDGILEKDRFKPSQGTTYGGFIDYTLDNGEKYRVLRDFKSGQVKIFDSEYSDITGNFDVTRGGGVAFAAQHLGINADIFSRTCFTSQLGIRLDSEGEAILADKISNLIETGDENLSYAQAKKNLEKVILEEVGTDRTSGRPINNVKEKIRELEAEEKSCRQVLAKVRSLEEELEKLRGKAGNLEAEVQEVSSMYELDQANKKAERLKLSQKNRAELENEFRQKQEEVGKINKVIPEGSAIFDEDVAQNLDDLGLEVKTLGKKLLTFLSVSLGVFIISLVLCFTFSGKMPYILALCATTLLVSAIKIKAITALRNEKNKEVFDILTAAGVDSSLKYIEKKKEISFLLEKRQLLYSSMELIKSQLDVLEEAAISFGTQQNQPDSGAINIPAKYKDKLAAMSSEQLEQYKKEKLKELRSAEFRINELETEIRVLSSQIENLAEIEEQLITAKEQEQKLSEFADCAQMAIQLLGECSRELKTEMLPELSKKLSQTVLDLTGRYNSLKINAGKEGIKISLPNGNIVPIGLLSGGTVDQIYLSLRLSALQMLSQNKEALPLILDEAFSQYDDERLRSVAGIICKVAHENQVIVFTCRQHEVDTFKAVMPEANLIRLSGNGVTCVQA